MTVINSYTRDGLDCEVRVEYGHACRKNRGRRVSAKVKIHRLICTYIVGVVPGSEVRPGSLSAEFVRTGSPVLLSVHPGCGCTMGQFAGKSNVKLTAKDVTCEKCGIPAVESKEIEEAFPVLEWADE